MSLIEWQIYFHIGICFFFFSKKLVILQFNLMKPAAAKVAILCFNSTYSRPYSKGYSIPTTTTTFTLYASFWDTLASDFLDRNFFYVSCNYESIEWNSTSNTLLLLLLLVLLLLDVVLFSISIVFVALSLFLSHNEEILR